MKKRVITSFYIVLVVAIMIALKFLPLNFGDYTFDIFILSLSIIANFEICSILERCNKRVNKVLTTFYPIFNYVVLIFSLNFSKFYLILLAQMVALLVYFLFVLIYESIRNSNYRFLPNLKCSLFSLLGCIYPSFLFLMFLNLNHIDAFSGINHFSVVLIVLVIAITFLTDTMAYLIGCALKGPKLAPKISPKKTISGAFGGLLGGILGAMLVFALVYNVNSLSTILNMYNLAWWHFLLVGLFASLLCQIGDLVESKIKRTAGIKDSGNIFPGHGGMLDRIDGLTFVVFFVFIFTLIII